MNTSTDPSTTVGATAEPPVPKTAEAVAPVLRTADPIAPVLPPAEGVGHPHETQTQHELATNLVGTAIAVAGIGAVPVGGPAGAVFDGAAGAMIGARGMSAAGERVQMPDEGSPLPGPQVLETLPTPVTGSTERGPGGAAPGVEPTLGLSQQPFPVDGYGISKLLGDPSGCGPPDIGRSSGGTRKTGDWRFLSLTSGWIRFDVQDARGWVGDSGAPNLQGDTTLVVDVGIGGRSACEKMGSDLRLDTPAVRSFLGQFLELP